MFIGYPYAQKGYRVFDLETKSIFVSRDISFHEDIFPFSTLQHHSANDHHVVLPLPIPDLTPSSAPTIPTPPPTSPLTLPSPPPPSQSTPPRHRSSHPHTRPSHLQDYVCSSVT